MTTNEAFVRDSVAAFNSGDLSAWLAFLDPAVRFYPAENFPDVEAVYEGHDGFARFWDSWWEPWSELEVEMATFEDVDGVIAMDIRWTGEGLDGPVVEWPLGIALMIRGSLIALLVAGETSADARARLREIQRNPPAS